MKEIENTIVSRIYGNKRGWCFTPEAFRDIGGTDAVWTALSRLTERGIIRRLARGIYDYPRKHPQLGLLAPDPDSVARALASRHAIRIQPSGAYATNMLGLSEQVPARIVCLTDGPARRVKIGGLEIILKRTAPRNMAAAGRMSGTVIQALKFIGNERLTSHHVAILRKKLSAREKKQLIEDRAYAPAWMHRWMLDIGGETTSNA